jgi:hypothetical protein
MSVIKQLFTFLRRAVPLVSNHEVNKSLLCSHGIQLGNCDKLPSLWLFKCETKLTEYSEETDNLFFYQKSHNRIPINLKFNLM